MAVRKSIAVCLWAIGLFALVVGAFFCLLLKDGLGPDAVDSHGVTSLVRFAQGMSELVPYYLTPLVAGALIFPWGRRR